jgi:uroporphyrin-III C-methyltransferase
LLVSLASQGKTVVRLKGGDPFVFGRGGEECQALAAAALPYEVIPGVSSAVSAPAAAGIPVTHRGVARTFTVVAGHTAGEDTLDQDWRTLARAETLVILMGLRNLPRIVERLRAAGKAASTPAAVVSCATTGEQATVRGTLRDIAVKAVGLPTPATVVIGDVVSLAEAIAVTPEVLRQTRRTGT